MFITDTRIENMAKALEITKDVLKDDAKVILGMDTAENVCEYVVSWHDADGEYKQAKVNVVTREWQPLTELCISTGYLEDNN